MSVNKATKSPSPFLVLTAQDNSPFYVRPGDVIAIGEDDSRGGVVYLRDTSKHYVLEKPEEIAKRIAT